MKLNIDCVRDVMLCIEENLSYNSEWTIDKLSDYLPEYSEDELSYTCYKLYEAELLNVMVVRIAGYVEPQVARIQSLTFSGHEYLENIRSPKIWQETKSFIKNAASNASLAIIGEVAKKLTLKSLGI